MTHRLYLASANKHTDIELDVDASHYLCRVLRLGSGASLRVFDGQGIEYNATVTLASTKGAHLTINEVARSAPGPQVAVQLILGVQKSKPMDTALQKATELGATGLWPVTSERTSFKPEDAQRKHAHWQKIIESAASQCERLHLPALHRIRPLADMLTYSSGSQRLWLDFNSEALPTELAHEHTCIAVGPEGGWSANERDSATAAGWRPVSLGPRILRAETAPLAALAAIQHSWGWPAS